MTCKEMHIEFNQLLQQVAANKTLKYLPEEVDLILNKAQNRFIQSKLKQKTDDKGRPSGGFEVSQLDSDALRTLIVSSYDLVPYIDQDGRRYRCLLPPDYSYLLSDWSYTTLLCDTIPKIITETLYVTAVRQDQSTKTTPKYYANMEVSLYGTIITIPSALPYMNQYQGYDTLDDIQFLTRTIALMGKWYWERFDNLYYPGYYIAVTTSNQVTIIPYISVDGIVTTPVKTSFYQVKRHDGTGDYYDNRLSATDNISGMNSTEFIKSSYYSPISELSNGILYVYYDSSFIVSSVGISYIRKPQPISLYLNTNCEIPEEFHHNIIDLAVEETKGTLGDIQGWQQKVADNNSRVVL